jgi:hypothetical protein
MKQQIAKMILVGTMFLGAANAEIFVRVAPPAPVRVGVYAAAPGPGYVWIDGYHEWVGGRYIWREGRWVRPPYAHATWVAPYWAPRHGGYAFVRGYWRR